MEIQLALDPRAEYQRRRYPGDGWPCVYRADLGHGCCHIPCKLAWLRAQGLTGLADRLQRNGEARDWLSNWGKLLYDPRTDGRHPERRRKAAAIMRAMRNGQADYAAVVRAGAWAGAAIGR